MKDELLETLDEEEVGQIIKSSSSYWEAAKVICQRFGREKVDWEEIIDIPKEGMTYDVFAHKDFRGKTVHATFTEVKDKG